MAIGCLIIALILSFLLFIFATAKVSGESADASKAEVTPKPTPKPTPRPEDAWVRYPVPLDNDIQKFIQKQCAEYQISPSLVMAVIGTESGYRADAIGDHGEAYGLMQIQRKWHEARMERLGVVNLMDPYQNVLVGIDLISELLDRDNGVEWALSYYSGHGGAPCDYAYKVLTLAECIWEGAIVCMD